MLGDFFRLCWGMVLARRKLFVLFNFLFFSCVFVVAACAHLMYFLWFLLAGRLTLLGLLRGLGVFSLFAVFLFNLAVAAFVVITLPGFVFFPLSAVMLLFRAFLWGLLVYAMPVSLFLFALAVMVFEGEAYVVAALAGTVVGFSWLNPKRAHGVEGLSRFEAFKRGLKECLRFYVVVALLLFVAAVIETVTILNV